MVSRAAPGRSPRGYAPAGPPSVARCAPRPTAEVRSPGLPRAAGARRLAHLTRSGASLPCGSARATLLPHGAPASIVRYILLGVSVWEPIGMVGTATASANAPARDTGLSGWPNWSTDWLADRHPRRAPRPDFEPQPGEDSALRGAGQRTSGDAARSARPTARAPMILPVCRHVRRVAVRLSPARVTGKTRLPTTGNAGSAEAIRLFCAAAWPVAPAHCDETTKVACRA